MLGIKVREFAPIVNVSLEDLVPQDHFYRQLERRLDRTFVHDLVQPRYAAGGRPSVDPVVLFKLQLILVFEGLRSERHRMRVVADRLSLRWYLGYDRTEPLPDHASLTNIRDRSGGTIFQHFFDAIVAQCQQEGLVWGTELYLDSTQVAANADRDQLLPPFYGDAVNTHLAALFPEGATSAADKPAPPEPAPIHLPVAVPAEVEAELATKHAARHAWITALGQPDRSITRWHEQRRSDTWVNTMDPEATLMHKQGGGTG